MTRKLMLPITVVVFSSALAWADKPEWAGQGGKPTEQQIEDHRNEMRNKNNDKSGQEVEPGKDEEKGEKDQDAKQSKNKEKDKSKAQGNESKGRDYSER